MNWTNEVTVRHNFETAHRLPHLPGKCTSLHGHSWWASVTVGAGGLRPDGTVVEFGALKQGLRGWVDAYLDHGSMLGAEDPLCALLLAQGCRVYRFDHPDPTDQEAHARGLRWPTVENVAHLLARVTNAILSDVPAAPGAQVIGVTVWETRVNAATWRPS